MERFPRKKKSLVINIRGSNGSGKSNIMFRLMDKFGATELKNEKGIWAYQVQFEPEFYVLGAYSTLTGGCDVIPTMRKISKGVQELALKGNVIFEGILVSVVSQHWIALAKSMPNAHFIFARLDTSKKRCIEQMVHRRKKEGYEGTYDPSHMLLKYKAVKAAQSRLEHAGMDTRSLSHSKPIHQIVNWLLEAEYGK
jgi:hypothetical protein